ncbi:MAG TPA: hypothetical protein DCL00_04590, partial [Opitutae bacterium]|nr:hypothetical protein [Opitutae bacterium]
MCLLALIFVWFWASLDIWAIWDLSLITLLWNYALVAMTGLLVATFGSLQNYGAFYIKNGWQRVRESFNKANFQSSLIAFFVFGSYFATKDNETSRLFLAFYIIICWPLLLGANFALPGIFKRVIGFRGMNKESLLIGNPHSVRDLNLWMQQQSSNGFSFCGVFSTSRRKSDLVPGLQDLGYFDDLENYLQENRVHQLVVLPDRLMEDWVSRVAELATQYGCRVLIYNNLSGLFDARLVFMEESGRQFFTLLNEPLESPFNQMVKRCFDLALSIPAILLILPPSILLVKLFQVMQAPGPVFFKQERVGLGGRKFVIWKFRSMSHAKDGERDESVQAHKGDDRIFGF